GFRRFLGVICDTPENIEANGGIRRYYERNKVEGVRLIAGVKGASSMEETVLEGDPESLLAAQRLAMESQPTLGLDMLMEAVGMGGSMDDADRRGGFAALGGLVGGGGAGGGGGSTEFAGGTGIGSNFGPVESSGSDRGENSPMPRTIVGGPGGTPFSAGSQRGGGGGSSADLASEGDAPFPGIKSIGVNLDYTAAEVGSGGPGLGTGNSENTAATGKDATGAAGGMGRTAPGLGFARVASSAIASDPNQVFDIAQKALIRSFSNSAADPAQALTALAHMLEEFNPEVLLPALSSEKRTALKGKPAREIAADFMEDVAAQWATNRLSSVSQQEDTAMTEAEVIRVLQRSLDATLTVERMLNKLSGLFEKANLPPEFYTRIQQELRWMELTDQEKFKQLMGQHRYSAAEFKRLAIHVKNTVRRGDLLEATELVEHYFAILDLSPNEMQVVELARAPELLQSIARMQTKEFMQRVAERLSVPLFDEAFRGWYHTHVANCLATAAHCMAPYEDFDGIYQIAQHLEKSRLRNPQLHKDCCGEALGNLLGPRSIERLVELYSLRRYGQRMVVSILRLMGRLGAEKIFLRLEEEKVASNRLALIRLIGQMGTVAHEVARGKLRDERWYVVRNACLVLNETHDPEIIQDLRETLRHTDERVQEAAFQVITKSKAAGRSAALADALPQLKPHVLEEVLKELRFMKSPESVPGLEVFISQQEEKLREKEEAMRALAAISGEGAADAMARILKNADIPPTIRRIAIKTLSTSELPVAYQALAEVASRVPHDPMAREAQAALEIE
ncbi:MAG TPA: HEAT repeat domain-containing protein, partial [Candidatus Angelobacter sp.]|nr:HEAT repeat domain-containing protein [Candidatus Angelobacter sp.]